MLNFNWLIHFRSLIKQFEQLINRQIRKRPFNRQKQISSSKLFSNFLLLQHLFPSKKKCWQIQIYSFRLLMDLCGQGSNNQAGMAGNDNLTSGFLVLIDFQEKNYSTKCVLIFYLFQNNY